MRISLDDLKSDLQKSGTDERLTRALLILAGHINTAFDGMGPEVEDIADDRITRYHERQNYWGAYGR